MGKDKISVRFCPKCKSFKVIYVQGISNLLGLIPRQRCLNCGYEASAFPILVTSKEALEDYGKKNIKKKIKKVKRQRSRK